MSPLLSAILARFDGAWVADTEYHVRPGEPERGICFAAKDLCSGDVVSRWTWDRDPGRPPWGPNDVVFCFSSLAEASYCLSCEWSLPTFADLWIARRITSNGLVAPFRHGLLHTLKDCGIEHPVDELEKRENQRLCERGGPYTEGERARILRYNLSDIAPLEQLAEALLPLVNLDQLIEFGRYSAHLARVNRRGYDVDVPRLRLLSENFDELKAAAAVEANLRMRFNVFGGPGRRITSFSPAAAEDLVTRRLGIADNWPLTRTGRLSFDRKTLKNLDGKHPDVGHMRRGRSMTTMRHPSGIHVGADGKCRSPIVPYMALTSRNGGPANSPLHYPGPLRALILPRTRALVIVDISQCDTGVAAGASGDQAMRDDYFSPLGDFYLAFGARSHLLPPSPSLDDPRVVLGRKRLKVAVNAIMYMAQAEKLSQILGEPIEVSRATIRKHRIYYPDYWAAAQAWVTMASTSFLELPSGWRGHNLPFTTAANFPIQGLGADVLRGVCLRLEALGFDVVWVQHDSVCVEVDAPDADEAAEIVEAVIGDVSDRIIGLPLRATHQIVRPGKRYFKDEECEAWWSDISKALKAPP